MFDLTKIADQIGEKLKPVLEETKKQAQLNMLVQAATQIYCAQTIRGVNASVKGCISQAKEIIQEAK